MTLLKLVVIVAHNVKKMKVRDKIEVKDIGNIESTFKRSKLKYFFFIILPMVLFTAKTYLL